MVLLVKVYPLGNYMVKISTDGPKAVSYDILIHNWGSPLFATCRFVHFYKSWGLFAKMPPDHIF